jgi:hypothetical protein
MVTLEVTDVSKALGVLGFVSPAFCSLRIALKWIVQYVCGFNLFSYVLRERLFISDSLLALGIGICVGPIALNWLKYAFHVAPVLAYSSHKLYLVHGDGPIIMMNSDVSLLTRSSERPALNFF